ncbi:hypothetical protein [Micromonospora saelicesensis]|uniref:hypothetical protein n=1 Tax=Micromonospora saelicesensis TaxID=285676 RepID=UPI003CE730DF
MAAVGLDWCAYLLEIRAVPHVVGGVCVGHEDFVEFAVIETFVFEQTEQLYRPRDDRRRVLAFPGGRHEPDHRRAILPRMAGQTWATPMPAKAKLRWRHSRSWTVSVTS